MNWTEFHFFKQPGGLSKNDALEMLICLDYERALECRKVVEFVEALSKGQRERMLEHVQRYRRLSRFVPIEAGAEPPVGLAAILSPRFQDFETAVSFPPVPAVCIAAHWFPKHWLAVSSSQRREVRNQVSRLYSIRRFSIFPFPMEPDETKLLINGLSERETLHVIAIDRTQPKSALLAKFNAWLNEQSDMDASGSRKGKINVPALLNDLGCYRLSKLDPVCRETVMADADFHRSVGKLSAAKNRAIRSLRGLRYV